MESPRFGIFLDDFGKTFKQPQRAICLPVLKLAEHGY
jgi:hypothetical protein